MMFWFPARVLSMAKFSDVDDWQTVGFVGGFSSKWEVIGFRQKSGKKPARFALLLEQRLPRGRKDYRLLILRSTCKTAAISDAQFIRRRVSHVLTHSEIIRL